VILPGAVGLPGPAPCRPLGQMSLHAPASLIQYAEFYIIYLSVTKVTLQKHASPGRDSRSTGLDIWTFPVHPWRVSGRPR